MGARGTDTCDTLVASAPEYEYSYDDIGNRLSSIEAGTGDGEQGTGGIGSHVRYGLS